MQNDPVHVYLEGISTVFNYTYSQGNMRWIAALMRLQIGMYKSWIQNVSKITFLRLRKYIKSVTECLTYCKYFKPQ